jgi:hypothetical protein
MSRLIGLPPDTSARAETAGRSRARECRRHCDPRYRQLGEARARCPARRASARPPRRMPSVTGRWARRPERRSRRARSDDRLRSMASPSACRTRASPSGGTRPFQTTLAYCGPGLSIPRRPGALRKAGNSSGGGDSVMSAVPAWSSATCAVALGTGRHMKRSMKGRPPRASGKSGLASNTHRSFCLNSTKRNGPLPTGALLNDACRRRAGGIESSRCAGDGSERPTGERIHVRLEAEPNRKRVRRHAGPVCRSSSRSGTQSPDPLRART